MIFLVNVLQLSQSPPSVIRTILVGTEVSENASIAVSSADIMSLPPPYRISGILCTNCDTAELLEEKGTTMRVSSAKSETAFSHDAPDSIIRLTESFTISMRVVVPVPILSSAPIESDASISQNVRIVFSVGHQSEPQRRKNKTPESITQVMSRKIRFFWIQKSHAENDGK